MTKYFVALGMTAVLLLIGAGCGAGEKNKAEGIQKNIESGIKTEIKSISESKQMKARQAFSLAEAKAREWSAGAKVVRIISGPDIKEDGDSGYWEFRFMVPGKDGYFDVVIRGGEIQETKAKEKSYYTGSPLPETWLDSDKLYERSGEKFKKLHPSDWQTYKISPIFALQCGSTSPLAKPYAKPSCILTYGRDKGYYGAIIDPATGDFIAELK